MSFNLNEEFIDGHLVTAEMKKLWAVEMDLAEKLLDVCKKHNLKIWATDGTLLGAVRHKGFIPWDDDMDFVMFRDDYDKLIEIGPKEFVEPYFLQTIYTDEHSWGGVVKLRRSNTTMIERNYQARKDFNRGVFIDILVLDAVPDERKRFEKKYKKIVFLRELLKNYGMMNPRYYPLKVRLKHAVISSYVLLRNPVKLHQKVESLLASNRICDNENCALLDFYALVGRDYSRVKLRNKHWFDETIMLPFHNMELPAPAGYDALLRVLYGDYMKPVKGSQSHGNVVVDCDRSYIEVLAELRNIKK